MFERFTEKAIKVIVDAQKEAKNLRHKCICPEHIFIGIIKQKSGIASKFLKAAGINYEKTVEEVKILLKSEITDKAPEILPFSPQLKQLLKESFDKSILFQNNSILPEHIFLSLIEDKHSTILKMLNNFDIDITRIKTSIERIVQKKSQINVHPETSKPMQEVIGQCFSISSLFEEEGSLNLMNTAVEKLKASKYEALGTEHLMLAVLESIQNNTLEALTEQNITKETFFQKLYEEESRIDEYDNEYLFTPKALSVLFSAYESAKELGSSSVLPEHILLGILKERSGLAYKILKKLNINTKSLQQKIINPIEKQTPTAMTILKFAQEEANRLFHGTIGSELLLLGVIDEGKGVGYQVLSELGVTAKDARKVIEKLIGHGNNINKKDFSLSINAKKILDNAYIEAKKDKKERIESEHFLLGIINEPDCVANKALENLGVDAIEVKQGIIKKLGK